MDRVIYHFKLGSEAQHLSCQVALSHLGREKLSIIAETLLSPSAFCQCVANPYFILLEFSVQTSFSLSFTCEAGPVLGVR